VRIAVLVKQIPAPVEFRMQDGRLVRDGVPLEVNAYCRRANAKAVELAGPDGEVVVFTMGPPAAADALREMIACGAHRGVHLCDPALAGADTLATAAALAAAIRHQGPFDLVLAGQVSVDNGGGQLPQRLGVLLGWPSVSAVEGLEVDGRKLTAQRPVEGGREQHELNLPAVIGINRRIGEPRYPSFRNIMKAKRKPVIAIEVTLEPSQLVCEQLRLPPQKTAGQIMTYGPGVADRVAHLIRSEAGIVW